jgi:ankyrin repeat protein
MPLTQLEQNMRDAIQENNLIFVKALIQQGVSVNWVDEQGYSPLVLAAEFNRAEFIQPLVDAGGDVNFCAEEGIRHTPLVAAAIEGHIEVLKLLLKNGADPNFCPRQDPPIVLAAQNFNFQAVILLAEKGANVNARNERSDDSHRTPLHYVAQKGELPTLKVLLAHNANINSQDIDGFTPLMLADAFDQHETINFLIKEGADTTIQDNEQLDIFQWAKKNNKEERILQALQQLTEFYIEPFLNESSALDESESDDDIEYAREEALKHVKGIINALKPTTEDQYAYYQRAIELTRRDLLLPTGRNQTAINPNAQLKLDAQEAVRAVALQEQEASCRHNPILNIAIKRSRKNMAISRRQGKEIFDRNGKIINPDLNLLPGKIYDDIRNGFKKELHVEFKRLNAKYKFILQDFDNEWQFIKWGQFLKRELHAKYDFWALHHISYRENTPRLSVSTRNLMLVTDSPRSSTTEKLEGTHAANHRMMAMGEPDTMSTQAPQILDEHKVISYSKRKSKKKPSKLSAFSGYLAETEDSTIENSKNSLKNKRLEKNSEHKYDLYLMLQNETFQIMQLKGEEKNILLLDNDGVALKFIVYTKQGLKKELSIPQDLKQVINQYLVRYLKNPSAISSPLPQKKIPGIDQLSFKLPKVATVGYNDEFELLKVPGDGNCFFYAVEHQLKRINYPKSYTHGELRQLAVKYMIEHIQEYHDIIARDDIKRESIDQYLERMKKDEQWAGDPEIKALAAALDIRIQISQPGAYQPLYGEKSQRRIHLSYNGKYRDAGHYDSLIPRIELESYSKDKAYQETKENVQLMSRKIELSPQDPIITYLISNGSFTYLEDTFAQVSISNKVSLNHGTTSAKQKIEPNFSPIPINPVDKALFAQIDAAGTLDELLNLIPYDYKNFFSKKNENGETVISRFILSAFESNGYVDSFNVELLLIIDSYYGKNTYFNNCRNNGQNANADNFLHVASDFYNGIDCNPIIDFLLTEIYDERDIYFNENKKGLTPFFIACKSGADELVRQFLKYIKRIDYELFDNDTDDISLYIIFENLDEHMDNEDENDVFINRKDRDGNTALHIAIENRNDHVAELLIAAHISLDSKNRYGKTALDIAKEKNFTEEVELLENVSKFLHYKNQAWEQLKEGEQYDTIVELAAITQHREFMTFLKVECGAPNSKNKKDLTSLPHLFSRLPSVN